MHVRTVFLLIAFGLPLSPLAADETLICPDGQIIVEGPESDLGGQICQSADRIRTELLECGLRQTRPLKIKIVDELSHQIGNCLAWFECDQDTIRLTNPARYGTVVDADSPYSELPSHVLLDSALTHELVHALVYQSAEGREIALVDHEYIAAALELELMEPQWRDVLIAAAPVSLPPKPGLIDIWIYGMAPRKFATNAWQHFRMPQNGCDLVRRILSGESTLSERQR